MPFFVYCAQMSAVKKQSIDGISGGCTVCSRPNREFFIADCTNQSKAFLHASRTFAAMGIQTVLP